MRAGRFIAFEGIDGAGKTSCIEGAASFLAKRGIPSQIAREPGTSLLGERLRDILKHGKEGLIGDNLTEALLFYAARVENVRMIKDWLGQGDWVLSDRFNASSKAYQTFDGSLSAADLEEIDRICLAGFDPDLVIVLDIDAEQVPVRLAKQQGNAVQMGDADEEKVDRFHGRGADHNRHLLKVYRQLAAERENYALIDARGDGSSVLEAVCRAIADRLLGEVQGDLAGTGAP